MSEVSAASDSLFVGDAFAAAAKRQFGDIAQRFFSAPRLHRPSLAISQIGPCGLSRISAAAHAVLASPASRSRMQADCVKVLVQVKGRSQFRQSGNRIDLGPDSAVIYDPAQPYAIVNPTAVDHIVLQIPRGMLGDKALRALMRPQPLQMAGAALALSGLIRTASEAAATLTTPMRLSIGQSLICFTQSLIVGSMAPELPLQDDSASLVLLRERIKGFVGVNLADPELSIAMLAQRMGCSARYLHRAFEAEGTSLQRFIWNARLERSRALLMEAGLRHRSISDTAFRCGFSSTSHFSRLFRQRFGMPPTDLRAG